MRRSSRRGFTLVELLVVIAIIGVLVAMTVPAIQASREMGRRNQCRANLANIGLAMQEYENAFESFPPGVTNPDGPIRSEAQGQHVSWTISLLPYLDEGNAYRLIDKSAGVYDPANAKVRDYWPRIFICPTDPDDVQGASNYAGCHHDVEAPIAADNHGLLFLNSHVRRDEISDGLSHTLLLSEKRAELDDLGWMSGTRATLRNTGLVPETYSPAPAPAPASPLFVGGFGSGHVGGVFAGLADGSVRFVAVEIDPQVWQHLGHRADGNLARLDSTD